MEEHVTRQETAVFGVVGEQEPVQVSQSIGVDRLKVVTSVEVVTRGLNEASGKGTLRPTYILPDHSKIAPSLSQMSNERGSQGSGSPPNSPDRN